MGASGVPRRARLSRTLPRQSRRRVERKRWEKRRKEAVLGGGIRCPCEGIRGAFAGHSRGIRFQNRAFALNLAIERSETCGFWTWAGQGNDTELPFYNIKGGEQVARALSVQCGAGSKILPRAPQCGQRGGCRIHDKRCCHHQRMLQTRRSFRITPGQAIS